jgi:hypothetical protein
MKKYLPWGLACLLLLSLCIPAQSTVSNSTIPFTSQAERACVNGTSFDANIFGPSFWMVIKATFTQNATIFIQNNATCSYDHSKYGYFIETYAQADFKNYSAFIISNFKWSDPEVYCHLGRLNWSIAHNRSKDYTDEWEEHFHGTIQGNGSFYFIFISSATNRSFDISIRSNVSGTFTVTQGETVYAFDRDNFLGGINLGWRRGVCMLNTKKTLEIDHFFMGWLGTVSRTGVSLLKYQMPNGTSRQIFSKNFLGNNPYTDFFMYGQSGTWQFHAMMIDVALFKLYPRVYLAGADLILPS